MMPTLHFIAKGVLVSQEFQSSLAKRNIFSAGLLTGGKKLNGMSIFCMLWIISRRSFSKERLQYLKVCNVSASASSKLHKHWFLTLSCESKKINWLRNGLVVPQSAFVHNQWRIWELSWKQGSVPNPSFRQGGIKYCPTYCHFVCQPL